MQRLWLLWLLTSAACGPLVTTYECRAWCGSDFSTQVTLRLRADTSSSALDDCFGQRRTSCPQGQLSKCTCELPDGGR